jgi:hypothetical protein
MYEHRTAYRHTDETVDGFIGTGFTKASAKADAIEQIKRKVDFVAACQQDSTAFDKDRIVGVLSSLAAAEIKDVQNDWRSGARW